MKQNIKRILLRNFDNDRYLWSVAEKELVELFKKWALEMVGEDEEYVAVTQENQHYAEESNQHREITNATKGVIRQNIEESTK